MADFVCGKRGAMRETGKIANGKNRARPDPGAGADNAWGKKEPAERDLVCGMGNE